LKRKKSIWLFALIIILSGGACVLMTFTALGSSLTLWLAMNQPQVTATPTATPRKLAALPRLTSSPSATRIPSTATPTPLPTDTATLVPTLTPSSTPSPTPVTPSATPPPPPPTPVPTDTPTPAPSFPFIILESEGHETNHLNFDVFVAITDENNKPLSGYRVLGRHSSGLQADSQVSAGDWTVNSGASQYKGGNLKYEAFNSPTGVWTLQLEMSLGSRWRRGLNFRLTLPPHRGILSYIGESLNPDTIFISSHLPPKKVYGIIPHV
jgi:hypothetical protein